jgi:surfeit locus 1 family protein
MQIGTLDKFTASHLRSFPSFSPSFCRRTAAMIPRGIGVPRCVPRCSKFRPRPAIKSCRTRTATTSARAPSANSSNFVSIVDAPPKLVTTRKKTSVLGKIILALIPFTAFCLGSWQVQRLDWKTKLIAKFEDRLVRDPLPLPPRIDPAAIHEFDYRRVYATGMLQHDKEMLVGPRMHDGKDGFFVITPLARGKGASTILVNRGWISREKQFQRDRSSQGLPQGEVTIAGLLREPWKKNMFTPSNKPEEHKFYFPDVYQMAEVAGAEPVWIEATMQPSFLESMNREENGIPIGRPAEVNLRNNHTQYIFTWYERLYYSHFITHHSYRYSLSAATTLMMWMVLRKKPSDITKRVRHTTNW